MIIRCPGRFYATNQLKGRKEKENNGKQNSAGMEIALTLVWLFLLVSFLGTRINFLDAV